MATFATKAEALNTVTMRILIVNTSELTGGAAVAASRLTEALINNGVKAKMMVTEKQSCSIHVTTMGASRLSMAWNFVFERFVIWVNNLFSRRHLFAVSIANTGTDITKTDEFREADVIHLHWINQGMLSIRSIRRIMDSGKPVVWTMHDAWPCMGICHHPYDCRNYQQGCGNCRFLRRPGAHDLSQRTMQRKLKALEGRKIYFVAVSNWLADIAKQSPITAGQTVSVVPNAISTAKFRPVDREKARQTLGLSADRQVILFGAARIDDPIKGFDYLCDALRLLKGRLMGESEQLLLILFGGIKDERVLSKIPIDYRYIGYVKETLPTLYSAGDVVVSSSLYETFGQTLIEAQACGCVPVSFGNSGQRDIIDHKVSGYLADYKSAPSLADGIRWALEAHISPADLRRRVVSRFSESVVARSYIRLYETLSNT